MTENKGDRIQPTMMPNTKTQQQNGSFKSSSHTGYKRARDTALQE